MRNHISGHVDHTVTLGQAGYGDALTITQSGTILPAYSMLPQPGADGIDIAASVTAARLLTEGSVYGALGATVNRYGYSGGVGINFSSAGRLMNEGNVTGGAGGYANNIYQYTGGNGGTVIYLDSCHRSYKSFLECITSILRLVRRPLLSPVTRHRQSKDYHVLSLKPGFRKPGTICMPYRTCAATDI